MPPKRNEELRAALRARHTELQNRPRGLPFIPTLCEEFSLARWQVQYYLREEGVDRRRKYSPAQRAALEKMTTKELTAYAEKKNLKPRSLIRLIRGQVRHKRRKPLEERLIKRGSFDFSNPEHLHLNGLNPLLVQRAKRVLKRRFKLSLGKDNSLTHPSSGRRCSLDTGEQVAVVRDPERFVVTMCHEIAERWVNSLTKTKE